MKMPGAGILILAILGSVTAQQASETPIPIREEVVVTADRIEARIGDTPASVVTFSRVEIESTAAPTIDDTLRQATGFSIFRRSSSRNANPTTQGVSLRGVGASGASRAVVLFDGVPLNDPFGGWVQWGRVSPIAVERIEVSRGGASSLYGDSSLSGAINVIPRKVEDRYLLAADVFGGSQNTISGSGFAGLKQNGWLADINVASFQTVGFKPVDGSVRGLIDAFAGVRSSSFSSKILRQVSEQTSLFIRPSYFGEVRTNGTGLQTNRTQIRQLIVGGNFRGGSEEAWTINWRTFSSSQVYDQIFSVINAARTSEALNRVQRVPAQTSGISGDISAGYKDHTFLIGAEVTSVRGASDEIAVVNNLATSAIGSGGRESTSGVFLQDFVRFGSKLVIVGSLRYDRWYNHRAFTATRLLSTNAITTNIFADRREAAFSPQFAALYHVSDQLSFYASGSRSFRSPTLNELYRAFRVGSVLTTANENLRAERATSLEMGFGFNRKRFSLRTNAFWTSIDRPIGNITISTTATLITRQRQNAGATRSAGIEVEAEADIGKIHISSGYLFAESIVTDFPSNTSLIGLAVPQVARHQLTLQGRYARSKWSVAIQARGSSEQFDDDLNLFRLEPYGQLDLSVARRVGENLQIYAAVENVFNSRYSVGRTPIRTVSSPANLRIGLRWK